MTINWEEQWASFAKNFYDGKAHIPIQKKNLLLLPGPGFGDLSHPTTYLMLKMMKKRVKNESVIDIGTGSGILSLAACLLNAKNAIGIDIDPDALKHARKNAKLNQISNARFIKRLPGNLPPSLFLMNMISSEQRAVHPQKWNRCAKLWIISGILTEERPKYLKEASARGWQPIEEHRRKGWLGWVFKMTPT